jgi:AcrR family transcriptional regulator
MTPTERRQRNRADATAGILQAAREVMREQGVAALNLQEVARRVGMRAPSLYEYFASKAALYDALFLLGTRMYAEHMRQREWDPDQPWSSIEAMVTGYMAFAQDYPELYGLVFERHVPGFVPSEASLQEAGKLLSGGYDKLRLAIDRGGLAPGTSAEAALDLLIALMHGLASQHLANDPDQPVGHGRFGSLIPLAVSVLRAAWEPQR